MSSVDLLKVSLDSLDPARVQAITRRTHVYKDALNAITWATSSGVPLGINVVLMRDTLDELVHIIDHVSGLSRSANGPVHLSLLDVTTPRHGEISGSRDSYPPLRSSSTLKADTERPRSMSASGAPSTGSTPMDFQSD